MYLTYAKPFPIRAAWETWLRYSGCANTRCRSDQAKVVIATSGSDRLQPVVRQRATRSEKVVHRVHGRRGPHRLAQQTGDCRNLGSAGAAGVLRCPALNDIVCSLEIDLGIFALCLLVQLEVNEQAANYRQRSDEE
jgi:hypothetical protein